MENIEVLEQNVLKIKSVLLKLVEGTKNDGMKVVVGAMTSLLVDAGLPHKNSLRLATALWFEVNPIV